MSVSKRTRFEVLRRDEFTCQYCGEKAPDVVLNVDHVMPVSLGGSDKPDNLLTACKSCNTGKSSIAPDSPLVVSLGAKAAAYALGMTDKMTRIRAGLDAGDDYCNEFEDIWNGFTFAGKQVPLPLDYESSLHRWFSMGVPIRMIQLAVGKSMALMFPKGDFGRFTYMAGIVWNRLNDDEIDYSLTSDVVHVFTEYEASERAVEGYEAGQKNGHMAGAEAMLDALDALDFIRHHIDGTSSVVSRALQWVSQ
jgi:hypothetical protein